MVREGESWEGRNDKLGFRQVAWLSQESCTWNVRMVVEENDKDYQATQIFMQWESSLKKHIYIYFILWNISYICKTGFQYYGARYDFYP